MLDKKLKYYNEIDEINNTEMIDKIYNTDLVFLSVNNGNFSLDSVPLSLC